ncbi:MAG: HNH endonuclease [Bacteroidetes bacterium]|nr:HNH endonuclease [Bacteroidota bacterium]
MKNGFITTEQLEKQYGYNHPPRAARDVREAGIPLETFRVKSKDGRNIAAYRFGDLTKIKKGKLHGRQVFSKGLKDKLYYEFSGNCSICNGHFENRYLQVDHRVPYEISGDPIDVEQDQKDFMLLCGSCNRAKSWSCKHCENWIKKKSSKICLTCYWGDPRNYFHIALQEIRRLDVQWEGEETKSFDRLKKLANQNKIKLPLFVKRILEKIINEQ